MSKKVESTDWPCQRSFLIFIYYSTSFSVVSMLQEQDN